MFLSLSEVPCALLWDGVQTFMVSGPSLVGKVGRPTIYIHILGWGAKYHGSSVIGKVKEAK
jgi:hypothetical protein